MGTQVSAFTVVHDVALTYFDATDAKSHASAAELAAIDDELRWSSVGMEVNAAANAGPSQSILDAQNVIDAE